jgi:hypothetical protein
VAAYPGVKKPVQVQQEKKDEGEEWHLATHSCGHDVRSTPRFPKRFYDEPDLAVHPTHEYVGDFFLEQVKA